MNRLNYKLLEKMEKKTKAKGDANVPSVNENIFKECYQFYVEEKNWRVDAFSLCKFK